MQQVWIVGDVEDIAPRFVDQAQKRVASGISICLFDTAELADAQLTGDRFPLAVVVDEQLAGHKGSEWLSLRNDLRAHSHVVLVTDRMTRNLASSVYRLGVPCLLKPLSADDLEPMWLYAKRRKRLGELGVRADVAMRATNFAKQWALTTKEHDVLALLFVGLRLREVAVELTISVATVRTHVRSILRKSDFADIKELVVSSSS